MITCPNCKNIIEEDYWDYCPKCRTEIFRPNRAFSYEQLFELMKLQDNRRQYIDTKASTYIGLLSIAVTIIVALGGLTFKNGMCLQLLISNNGFIILSVLYVSTVLLFIIGVIFAFRAHHIGSPIIKIDGKYLFSWDNVPGKDNKRLLKFLRDDLHIVWAENATISKSYDGKTISIFKGKGKNLAEIVMDGEKKKAILKISGGETHDLKVKENNGKLKIYTDDTTKKVYRKLDENWLVENSEEGLAFLQKSMIYFLGNLMLINQKFNIQKSNNLTYAYYISITAIISLLLFCVAIILSLYTIKML
jgi:hypothetical protein